MCLGEAMNLQNYETKDMRNSKMKRHILDVALPIMRQIGYDNLTIRMICNEAGISTGMFYQHFSSKEDLLACYSVLAEENFETHMDIQLSELPLREQLVEFSTWICTFTSNLGPDFCRNFFSSKSKSVNTDRFKNMLRDTINTCLEKAVSDGFQFTPGRTLQAISRDISVIIRGIIFDWSVQEGSYDMAEYSRELFNRCIDGLL